LAEQRWTEDSVIAAKHFFCYDPWISNERELAAETSRLFFLQLNKRSRPELFHRGILVSHELHKREVCSWIEVKNSLRQVYYGNSEQ